MLAGQSRRRPASDDGVPPKQKQPKRRKKLKNDFRCTVCIRMFSQRGLKLLNSPSGFRHGTRVEFIDSKSEGCRMCGFILTAVLAEHDGSWDSDDCLIFHNFQNVHTSGGVPRPHLSGIYGLAASLGSNSQECILKICVFAESGMYIVQIWLQLRLTKLR